MTTTATDPARDWRARHDVILAELVADGVEARMAPLVAYTLAATEAGRAIGGDFYAGCAELTGCEVMWPARSTIPTRLWSRLRDGDDFQPGDNGRAARSAQLAAVAAARNQPQQLPAWQPTSCSDFLTSARPVHRERLFEMWKLHHRVDAVRADAVAAPIRAFVAGSGEAEATPAEVLDAVARALVGFQDAAGRVFAVLEHDEERKPVEVGLAWPAPQKRPLPRNPEFVPWHGHIEAQQAALLADADFHSDEPRRSRVLLAQAAAIDAAAAAYAAEAGVPAQEARRRFQAVGLTR